MRLLEYLRRAVDDGASDLFLVAGGPISYKLEGRIRPMEPEKAAPADTLRINIVNGSAPCIITPEDGGDSFLYMVLPVRLKA